MNRGRRRAPRKKTAITSKGLLVGAGVVLAGGAVAAAVTVWPDDGTRTPGGSEPSPASSVSAARSSPSASPSPSRSYPLSQQPRTIPAVREHRPPVAPAGGPPTGARVVVRNAALADEGG